MNDRKFSDRIANVLGIAYGHDELTSAEYVLAMPEMVAIRDFMRRMSDWTCEPEDQQEYLRMVCRLPESVIAWVVGE